jgi:hypothetical protein
VQPGYIIHYTCKKQFNGYDHGSRSKRQHLNMFLNSIQIQHIKFELYASTWFEIHRGYGMSVGLILNLLNELNKIILCEPLASKILFYSTSSIN